MIELPQVTLCCVDTRHPGLALEAIARCRQGLRFADALLFTDLQACPPAPQGVRLLPARIESTADYSAFMLKGLAPFIETSHMLVVQWDGFVLHPQLWDPSFLQWDYIGPRWHDAPTPALSVGNGGFSLRSRKLLQALQDPAIVVEHPEDVCICRTHRERLERDHGIRFAAPEVADRFGFERTVPQGAVFGFHGLMNFHRVMSRAQLHDFLRRMPDDLARNLDAHDLCAALIDQGDTEGADLILQKRRRLGMRDRRTLRLRWRLWRSS
jgi:hypothetical protein